MNSNYHFRKDADGIDRLRKDDTPAPDSLRQKLTGEGELYRLASLIGTDAKTPFANLLDYLEKLITAETTAARIDELQMLLDAEDQETDLDGRATTPPYHIINNDGARYLIEQRIAALTAAKPQEGLK